MSGRRWIAHPELAAIAEAAALGMWLIQPSLGWAFLSFVLGGMGAMLAARRERILLAGVALLGLVGATTAGVTSARVRAVESRWAEVREDLIRGTGLRLTATLESTVGLARALADHGAAAVSDSQPAAFDRLERAVGRGGPEGGVVVLDADGRPWSWAGRHRLPPTPPPRELYARITPFYVVLEARRQVAGRTAIGHVVLAADSVVPDRGGTVAARFSSGTGASLQFYAPRSAPHRTDVSDVFDYCQPSCAPGPGNAVPDTLFTIRTAPPAQGTFKLALLSSGGRTVAFVMLLALAGLMVVGEVRTRYLALGLTGAALLFTPAGLRLGLETFFSPATYYFGALDPLTASAGALGLTGAICILAVATLRNAVRPSVGIAAGVVAMLATPHVARLLARGIAPPASGVGVGLWVGWELPLALVLVGLLMLVAALLPQLRAPESWVTWMGGAWSIGLALIGVGVWRPEGGFPVWFSWLWVPAIFFASQVRTRMRRLVAASMVAGSAAVILTWGAAVDGRLRLARADAQRVAGERDPLAVALLDRIGNDPGPPPRSAADLYARWQRSPLAAAGYPAVLGVWNSRGELRAELVLADLDLTPRLLQAFARSAAAQAHPVLESVDGVRGAHAVLAKPFPDGSVMTVGIGPKTRLIAPSRIARILGPEARTPAPYEMTLSDIAPGVPWQPEVWRREGQTVHGDGRVAFPGAGGPRHLHVTVELGEIPGLLIRGALLLFLDVGVAALLWLFAEALQGRTDIVARVRGLVRFRSYRFRIAVALAVFFIVPTLVFATWMAGRLRADVILDEDLVIRQALRDASGALPEDRPGAGSLEELAGVADRVDGELLLYRAGALQYVSAPLLAELGLLDAYLPPPVYRSLLADEGAEALGNLNIAGRDARVGFRAFAAPRDIVLAMPRIPDDRLPMGGGDLAYALLLATLIGLGAAAALAKTAARALAEPVGVLRAAADIVGRGGSPAPFASQVPEEFVPVAEAFTRMAADVQASQAALEAGRQRTVAVLRNVATGVIALNADLAITLANPRAEELLGRRLEPGAPIDGSTSSEWGAIWTWVREFLRSHADLADEEFLVEGRRIRVRASALGTGGGCVVALDDVTDLAHAVRVLAWGEIARQVAHEIKNPLTPMRLGIQHLQRAYGGPRAEFEEALERTAGQILAEIDRLDDVARAFARFGAPPPERETGPLAPADLVAVARETVALYALGEASGVELSTDGVVRGIARPDELREVLLNLVENARLAKATRIGLAVRHGADARRVRITVTDNGTGIRAEDLPRIFEPHFSTTTSGTGLGLAICKRLVESWGGTIGVESEFGRGTTVTIEVAAA